MKSLPSPVKYGVLAVALVVSIIILSCAQNENQRAGVRGKVTIRESGILIQPGTKLSESDQKAMNNILANYDKSLYKVQVYENGQLKKTLGTLRDIHIDKATASAATKAMTEAGSTQYVLQIGFADKTNHPTPSARDSVEAAHPTPPDINVTDKTHVSPTPSDISNKTNRTQRSESEELVKRLTPILEKYRGD